MTFKHYLNFVSLPSVGKIRISEPYKFDGSSFKIKQDDKRFGRDIYIADEEIELEFTRDEFERLNEPQRQLNGQVINHASLGFDYLLDVFQNEGWEGKVEHIIEDENNVEFVRGVVDMFTAVVNYDVIKFKIVQDTNRELIKRLEDTEVNAFSDTAIDGREIEPCQTVDVLQKALPITENSVWEGTQTREFNTFSFVRFNPFMTLNVFGVQNSLVPFRDIIDGDFAEAVNNFRYIRAITDLSNGKIKIEVKATIKYRPNGSASTTT